MKLAVCDSNHEPLHDCGGKSVGGFNMRNIPFKNGRVQKHNFMRILIGK